MELNEIQNVRFKIFKFILEKTYNENKNFTKEWYVLRDEISEKLRTMTFEFVRDLNDNNIINDNMTTNCIRINVSDINEYIKILLRTKILKTNGSISKSILEDFDLDDLNHIDKFELDINNYFRYKKLKKLIK